MANNHVMEAFVFSKCKDTVQIKPMQPFLNESNEEFGELVPMTMNSGTVCG